MQLQSEKLCVVLDLETTGLSAENDAIIEIACIKFDLQTFQITDEFHTFVNPEIPIPELISQITQIYNTDVENAPKFSQIQGELQNFLQDCIIVGHNISFDIGFLQSHGIQISGAPKIDTFFLANFLCFQLSSLNLGFLCEHFSIDLSQAHRALDDTRATFELFQKLVERLKQKSSSFQSLIYSLFFHSHEAGYRILAGTIFPLFQKDSFDPFSYLLEKFKEKYSTISTEKQKGREDFGDFFERSSHLELRESQKIMIDIVDKTLKEGKKALIEAPTGIGKTFAYLLPSISLSKKIGEKVHISTSTKALQDQIFYKDLSYFSSLYPESFSYCKLKGRKNYVSLLRTEEFYDALGGDISEISFFLKIYFWILETEFGELDELNFYGPEYSFLHEIDASASEVLSETNTFLEYEFLYQARSRARTADIIVTNNHILFHDALSDGFIFGGVKNLIIDEAHSLEDVVTQSLRRNMSYEQILKSFARLESRMKKKQFISLEYKILKDQILYGLSDVFQFFEQMFFPGFQKNGSQNVLLRPTHISAMKEILPLVEKLIEYFCALDEILKEKNFSEEIFSCSFYTIFLNEWILHPDFQKHICFVSYSAEKSLEFSLTLLSPGSFLQENIWDKVQSVILTSATLQMQGSFEYIQNILKAENFETHVLPSLFDYKKQGLVYIPKDIGSVKQYTPAVGKFLERLFETVRGKTLVLCTSFQTIREIYSLLKGQLQQQGIQLLAQSISGSKYKQIESFKQHSQNSILLGTDSFWEGVDIPGDDLKYLVIHKIPFMVPTDPIFLARSVLFQNSFEQYSIPKAILKLKQGFGRLIRTSQDTGIIIFLDERIYSTSWGEKILDAFPENIPIKYGESEKFFQLLSERERPEM